MRKKIDFTVLIPVYNTPPDELIDCIHSVLTQSYKKPYPVLVYDDGSTNEETLKVLRSIAATKNCRVIGSPENLGTPVALNNAHAIIETEYIMLCGSDDLFAHEKIEKQVNYLQKYPGTDVLGCNLYAFKHCKKQDISGNILFSTNHASVPKPSDRKTNHYWLVNHGTAIYKNEAVKLAGGYNPELRRHQDVELWRRMWEQKFIFRNIPDKLYYWRRYN